jgi:hypothetical protein
VLENKAKILYGYTSSNSKLGVEKSGSGRKERINIRSISTPKHYTYNSFLSPLEIGIGNTRLATFFIVHKSALISTNLICEDL